MLQYTAQFEFHHTISMQKAVSSRQQQLLSLLMNSRDALSIDCIARELDLSRTAIQQHITVLQRDGFIEPGETVKTAGRPIQTYLLSESGIGLFTKQYSWFSSLLLDELKQQLGSDGLKDFLHKLGTRQATALLNQVKRVDVKDKIQAIAEIMQDMGYETSVLEQRDGERPVINACNCVYHDLAQKYPEVCQFDQAMLSTLSDSNVEMTECMAKGGCACHFSFN